VNALQVNPVTGFLESPSPSKISFDSDKKLLFLKTAEDHFREKRQWPDLNDLCQIIGIDPRTLQEHMKKDERFREAWENIKLPAKWGLESKMYEYAQRPGGYMHMVTWLRHEFPDEYNPETKIIHSSDNSNVKSLVNAASEIIEGEIVNNPALPAPHGTDQGPKGP
jgi:hypothetical protein